MDSGSRVACAGMTNSAAVPPVMLRSDVTSFLPRVSRSIDSAQRWSSAASKAFMSITGVGGQPGIFTSTGMTFSTAPQLA